MLLVILACNPPWFSIRLSTIHEVADPLAINTMWLRRAAQRIIPSLHRYSVTVKFLPLLYAKNYFYIYIYIYKYKEYFRGGGIGRFFTVTL